jgi:hypothetical protein
MFQPIAIRLPFTYEHDNQHRTHAPNNANAARIHMLLALF